MSAKTSLEVADIFKVYGERYIEKYQPCTGQLKVMKAITSCRTEALGSQSYACKECGNILHVYHSCRNRHCPKCQHNARERWLDERKNELLPVKYFHLIFTVPASLNEIALFNKSLFYDVLFSSVKYTLSTFSNDPKWMGAQYGAVAILHSWGQNLSFHPHLHVVVPAGGISEDKMEWISTRKDFFAPVKAMSITFRKKFCSLLQSELNKHYLGKFSEELDRFGGIISKTEKESWVVFAQKPFKKPQYIIDYLGNYTHRVAISNFRLIKIENGYVYFFYKDYKQDGKRKVTKLAVLEFIRRFLQHVLPYRFCKIRYFGFLANRFKQENLNIARQYLAQESNAKVVLKQNVVNELSKISTQLILLTGSCTCPCCGGTMVLINQASEIIRPMINNSS